MSKKMNLLKLQQAGFHGDVTDEERLSVLTEENFIKQLSIIKSLLDNNVLRIDIHYRKYEDSKQYGLMKAGADAIALYFNLVDNSTQIDAIEQPFKTGYYTDNKKRITTKGYYYFKIKSSLVHKRSGDPWGSCIGLCHSLEDRYRVSPAGTILKVAGNRAYIGAIIKATSCSEFFVIDDKDMATKDIQQNNKSKLNRMKSNKGSIKKPIFCRVCNQSHIKPGDWIVKIDNPYNGWVSEDCFKKIK